MEKLKPLALLLLRMGLGAIFIYHGYPKLFSHSHEVLFDMANRNGLPGYVARLAGVVEVFGGAMLVVGVFTRFVGLLLTAEVAFVLWLGRQLFAHPTAVGRYELPLACAWECLHSQRWERAQFQWTQRFSARAGKWRAKRNRTDPYCNSREAGPAASRIRIWRFA